VNILKAALEFAIGSRLLHVEANTHRVSRRGCGTKLRVGQRGRAARRFGDAGANGNSLREFCGTLLFSSMISPAQRIATAARPEI
jgi:hypothetical protein